MTNRRDEDIANGQFLQSCDKRGNCIEVCKYGEDFIPTAIFKMGHIPDPRTHFPLLRDMQIRDDDILLCAYMKAGTHWVWEIIAMLTGQSTEYAAGPKEDTMIEFRSVEKLDALPSPRILNTHIRFNNIPKGLIERKCRIVFVVRNPKDIAVSMYNHISAKGSAFAYKGSFDDFLSLFMSDVVPHNAWPGYMTGWETDFALHPDVPRHIIYYEDLKQNPVHEVKMLASYLNVTCTDSFIDEIVDKCSFAKLKEGKAGSPKNMKWNFLYRKGEVGEWKNWFTVAQNEEFDRFLQTSTKDSNFVYKYTI
ncbi:sulfotransferase 1C4-like isoform X1 [Mizuhopecten yessoensis]|uniref:Sulfotransferase 1C4 n=1 Tax=Mizuhopecten yessoensis TaxID=6573 RepID=A0A210PIP6_MIZYE|nr:sulfotransferase 1C4-like isoform X1 [Mizuhopecten yessoensis]OWF36360.1 Sulfotransferase 1C4 [Mizuhopecten yessoensis]